MLIAGDGKSHIYKTNSLDSSEWDAKIKSDFKDNGLVVELMIIGTMKKIKNL